MKTDSNGVICMKYGEFAVLFRIEIFLGRLIPVLEERGFPHPSQSAYIKERSCTDGIISTYEVLNTLIQDGDSPCLFGESV